VFDWLLIGLPVSCSVLVRRWPDIEEFMAAIGYDGVLQDRGKNAEGFACATFFSASRFELDWTESRSRALLLALHWQEVRLFSPSPRDFQSPLQFRKY
jgi:hypothetical protein